jgi:nucleotide-binding universal stress UspA family protein
MRASDLVPTARPLAGDVVVLVDTASQAQYAAWRGALIARECGAPLRLLHTCTQAQARVLARQMRNRTGVFSIMQTASCDLERELAGLSHRTGLLVVPHRRGNFVGESLFGSVAQRLFRAAGVPTLVVKRPAMAGYRRVLACAEVEDDAAVLVRSARCFSRTSLIRVLHVLARELEDSLRIADVSEQALRLHRQRRQRAAYEQLERAIARAGASEAATALVAYGDAWLKVLEVARANKAQLVVLGQRADSLLERLFRVSVGLRLTCEGDADVLLVPLPRSASPALDGMLFHPMNRQEN